MNDRGVPVEFIKENMSFTAGSDDPRSALMFTMLSAFAQFERSLLKERQREGIALAKAKGTRTILQAAVMLIENGVGNDSRA
jgi:DNA invertase Pin-like site-specific DNA recombinase